MSVWHCLLPIFRQANLFSGTSVIILYDDVADAQNCETGSALSSAEFGFLK
jgi:hypothetical protein